MAFMLKLTPQALRGKIHGAREPVPVATGPHRNINARHAVTNLTAHSEGARHQSHRAALTVHDRFKVGVPFVQLNNPPMSSPDFRMVGG